MRSVRSAKTKAVRQGRSHLFFDGGVWREVESGPGAHWINVLQIDRRRNDSVPDGEHRRENAHGSGATEQMASHRFHAADMKALLVLGETRCDRGRLFAIAARS